MNAAWELTNLATQIVGFGPMPESNVFAAFRPVENGWEVCGAVEWPAGLPLSGDSPETAAQALFDALKGVGTFQVQWPYLSQVGHDPNWQPLTCEKQVKWTGEVWLVSEPRQPTG